VDNIDSPIDAAKRMLLRVKQVACIELRLERGSILEEFIAEIDKPLLDISANQVGSGRPVDSQLPKRIAKRTPGIEEDVPRLDAFN